MAYSTRAGRLSSGYLACIAVCLAVMVVASPESPHLLNVLCPNTYHDQGNITISIDWTSTISPDNILNIWIEKVCLNGNNTDNNVFEEYNANSLHRSLVVHPGTVCLFKGGYALNRPIDDEDLWSIRLESCEVPALQSTGKAQLQLNCSDSVAAVEVITPDGNVALNSTNFMGKCITPDWRNGILMQYIQYLESGYTSISGLPDDTICSFNGTYQLLTSEVVDFEPVQCIMNRPSPPTIPLPPTTTEHTTTTTTSATSRYIATATSTSATSSETSTSATSSETSTSATSSETSTSATSSETSTSATSSETSTSATSSETSTSATSSESTTATSGSATSIESATTTANATTAGTNTLDGIVSTFIVVISFIVSMAILVVTLALVATACSAWKCYHWKMKREQMKQLHIWDCFPGKENLDQDPHVLPQFPHAPDSLSISTEVDYLYKEEGRTVLSHTSLSSLMKSMKNDETAIGSPKLIMDRFLDGCHQRVWESSHESFSNVPPSPTQEQGSRKLAELHCADTNPVPSDSNLVSDSGNVMAQHFTLNTNQQYNLDDSVTKCAADNCVREFTPSSVPTEHYFTDDEGYLRFTK